MNQHVNPPENVREIATIKPAPEQFIVVRGRKEKWIDGDLMDRSTVIAEVSEDYSNLTQIIAFSLETGTCRDATGEITETVIRRWAEDDKELSREAYEFVELCCGTTFANAFRRERV